MENKIIIPLIIVAFALTIFIVSEQSLDKRSIDASFTLSEKGGLDLTPQELTFGSIQENQSATRSVLIENKFEEPIKIVIKSSGEISKNIIVSENNFILNQDESKNITFTAYTNGLTEFRKYSGSIEIISKRA